MLIEQDDAGTDLRHALRDLERRAPFDDALPDRLVAAAGRPLPVRRRARLAPVAATVVVLLVASVVAIVLTRGRGPDDRGRPPAGPPPATRSTRPPFRFSGPTPPGHLVPEARRERAGNLAGTDLAGRRVSLAGLAGHVVVVIFWATWAAPSRVQLRGIAATTRGSHAAVLGVDTRDDSRVARAYVRAHTIRFPSIDDDDGSASRTFGGLPGLLPTTLLIDRSRNVAAVYTGDVPANRLRSALRVLAREHR